MSHTAQLPLPLPPLSSPQHNPPPPQTPSPKPTPPQALDRLTRLEVFQEHIRLLEEEERQEREKEKEAKRRQERRNRDTFRQMLQQHRCLGRSWVPCP